MENEFEPMTYAELADRLGIAVKSAKNRAHRKNWRRVPGNDGKVLVHVPLSIFDGDPEGRPHTPPHSPPEEGHEGGNGDDPQSGPEGALDPSEFVILRETIARLETRLEAEQRRSAELMERHETDLAAMEERREGDLDALRALLTAERERGADLRADRDRWVEMAARRGLLARLFGRAA